MQLCPVCESDYLEYDQGSLITEDGGRRSVHVWVCPSCGYAEELTPDEQKKMVEK